MANTKITIEVQEKVNSIIDDFNKMVFKNKPNFRHYAIYKNDFLFICRKEGEKDGAICRLRYKGKFTDWDFAIYKYSSEQFDKNEYMFPGAQHINGTIEGALNAGMEAYPPSWTPTDTSIFSFLSNLFRR